MVRLVTVGGREDFSCFNMKCSECEEEIGIQVCDLNKVYFCPACGEKVTSIRLDPRMVVVPKEYI
jgi:Zn finger protein HypA/HybF involved in hydrogenase expression